MIPDRGRLQVTILALVGLAALVAAAPAGAGWQRFVSGRDDIPDNEVYGILETAEGVLWFGTPEGAARYDGFRWRTFQQELPDREVNAIVEDPAGDLWFATQRGGVARYDGTSWETYSRDTGALLHNQVSTLLVDRAGDVWCGTPAGLSRYQPASATWTTYTQQDGSLIHPFASALLEDRSGNLWVGTPEGVSRLDPGRSIWTDYPRDPAGLASDSVLVIAEDLEGGVWFGTDQGAFRLKEGVWTPFNRANSGLLGDAVTAMEPDDRGGMWFGGFNGLSHYDGRTWRTWTQAGEGQLLSRIVALHLDRSGNLWAASVGGSSTGLYRFDRVEWVQVPLTGMTDILEDAAGEIWVTTGSAGVFRLNARNVWSKPPGLPLSAESLYEDPQRNLWIGLSGQGLMRLGSDRQTTELFGAESLPGLRVHHVLRDSRGTLWVATDAGVAARTGTVWQSHLDGAGPHPVSDVFETMEDGDGDLWFRTSTGLYRLDAAGGDPVRMEATSGTATGRVTAFLTTASGDRWFGTDHGVSRLDAGGWTEYPSLVAANDTLVNALAAEAGGAVWVASMGGATRFEGTARETYDPLVLGTSRIIAVLVDDQGTVWLSRDNNGLARTNGDTWRVYDTGDGLASGKVTHMLQDGRGNLWFASFAGITEHRPDRTAPQTIFSTRPKAVIGIREASFVFAGAYGEGADIEYQVFLDGMERRDWSPEVAWDELALTDGPHLLEARSRDWARNIDPTPAQFAFEVDATQPGAILSSPFFGEAVKGTIAVEGTAADPRFVAYRVQMRPEGEAVWSDLRVSDQPVTEAVLATWDTGSVPDGFYELRLVVSDDLGLNGIVPVTVLVDNAAPFAEVTAPVVITGSRGGDVYSVPGDVHLYFPPGAFARDATVRIDAADLPPSGSGSGPDSILIAVTVTWGTEVLNKPATLDMQGADSAPGPLVLYAWSAADGWNRLGGTDRDGAVSLSVSTPGTYVLGTPTGSGMDPTPTPRPLVLTPRVFSPTGGFAASEVAISFSLRTPGPVQVKVFNRAGRLVRRVLDEPLGAGVNLVRWDGRSDGGDMVPDGLYIVAVQADGELHQKTLSVVR